MKEVESRNSTDNVFEYEIRFIDEWFPKLKLQISCDGFNAWSYCDKQANVLSSEDTHAVGTQLMVEGTKSVCTQSCDVADKQVQDIKNYEDETALYRATV